MTHDPKLVETVAAWLQKGRTLMGRRVMHPVEGGQPVAEALARDLLAAIDASGTHWVAPQAATTEMQADFMQCYSETVDGPADAWAIFRDACLAERGEKVDE